MSDNASNASNNVALDFDSLLDRTVDDLADLKGFEPLPAGSYMLLLSWDKKLINDMPALIMKLKVIEVLELSDSSITAPAVDATSDIALLLAKKNKETGKLERNEIGEGQLKQVLEVLVPVFGGKNIGEVIAASEGAQIAATLKVRVDSRDNSRSYNQIKTISTI